MLTLLLRNLLTLNIHERNYLGFILAVSLHLQLRNFYLGLHASESILGVFYFKNTAKRVIKDKKYDSVTFRTIYWSISRMAHQVENLPTVNPPPIYTPLLWPFLYVYEGIRAPEKIKVPNLISKSHLDLFDNVFSFVASIRSFLMAYAVVYWLHGDNNPYPAWGKGSL